MLYRRRDVGRVIFRYFLVIFFINNAMKNICYVLFFLVLASVSQAQSWQKVISPGLGSRDATVAFSIGNKIYSGGGGEGGDLDFYEYDPGSNKWTKKANIPGVDTNRGFAAAFAINGKGYVGLGSDHINAPSVKHDLWEYDPATDSWTRKADFPAGNRDGIGVFVLGNIAYIAGGADSVLNVYQEFYAYDPVADTWTAKADLPTGPNIFPSMFSIGNYGYLACGAGNYELTDLWRYDPVMDSWDQMTSFPGAARQAGIAYVLNGKGYVGLGQTQYTSVFNDIYSYDPSMDSWQQETNFSGKARAWATAITLGDTVYIGNGSSFSGQYVVPLSDWWSFAPAVAFVSTLKNVNSDIRCYPQPATSEVYLSGLKNGGEYEVRISDALGREVSVSTISGTDMKLNIGNLSPGMYTVYLNGKDDRVSFPVIKE